MKLVPNVRLGPLSQKIDPGHGWCGHCETTWGFVTPHTTTYQQNASGSTGCFPLCETCWSELTRVERLPYYRALYDRWIAHGSARRDWEAIRRAVLSGG